MEKKRIIREEKGSKIGRISFIIGFGLAAIIALFSATAVPAWTIFTIAILGVIVGLLNITDEEVKTFLIAAIAFIISFQALSTVLSSLAFGWTAIPTFFGLMNVFITPAAAIVAIKALFP
ncbi:MAG: hypothetical protein ACOCQQ_02715, partial [Candidatus Nanoarchaeia archaeon]